MRNIFKGFNKKKRRNNDTQEQRNPAPHERHGTTSDKISVVVNTILAIFTLVAIYFAYQANQTSIDSLKYAKHKDSMDNMAQQVRDSISNAERLVNRKYVDSTLTISTQSVDAAKKSSEISEQALNETKKSYDFSRDAAIKELRSYVVQDRVNINNFIPDSIYQIETFFNNVGKTPAYKMRIIVGTVIFSTSQIDKQLPGFIKLLENNIDTAVVLNLGSAQSTGLSLLADRPLSNEEVKMVINGKSKLFVGANVTYYDAFGGEHFTHILGLYIPSKNIFYAYKIYNETK